MTAEQIIFLLTGALILGSALMVVTTRKLLHAALWLGVGRVKPSNSLRGFARKDAFWSFARTNFEDALWHD